MTALVTTDWLAQNLGSSDICVLDGSWYLPSMNRNPAAEFDAAHIPGAQFFDISTIKDASNPLPHMLPSSQSFEIAVRKLGANQDSKIVIYDGAGISSSARVWWMFRAMGHNAVCVLDGGLPKWIKDNRAVTNISSAPDIGDFIARPRRDILADWTQVLRSGAQVLDARAPGRFEGATAEPRKGLRSGHMPGAKNIPHTVLKTKDGTLKSKAELRQIFKSEKIDPHAPIITSCGSGITACVIALALHQAGMTDAAVYDGSWAEWGARHDLPIQTGPA